MAGCQEDTTEPPPPDAPAATAGAEKPPSEKPRAEPAEPEAEKGSVEDLRERAAKVMDALKKGDAKAAAAFCNAKHCESFEKYIAETIEKKDQARYRGYRAWDGNLGEIRIKDTSAWVKYAEDDRFVQVLLFRKKDDEWGLFDIAQKPKSQYATWGEVAKD